MRINRKAFHDGIRSTIHKGSAIAGYINWLAVYWSPANAHMEPKA